MRTQSLPNIIRSAMQSALSKKKKHHVEASTYVIIMKRLKRQQTGLIAALTWISVVAHSTISTRGRSGGAQCFYSVPQDTGQIWTR